MSYVRLTDAQTAYKAALGQDFFRQMRDNQDDHESRIVQLLAQSHQAVVDDFLGDSGTGGGNTSGVDENLYDVIGGSGVEFRTMVQASGDHVLKFTTTNSAISRGLSPKRERLAFQLNQDMVLFGEWRAKDIGGAAPDNLMFGYTDTPSDLTDESDCIAFLKSATAGKWRFRVAKTASGATTTDNIGNRATWQKLRIEIVRSGGGSTFQVRAYIDGAEIAGSPFTTNLPDSVVLRMVSAFKGTASGTTDVRLDRQETRWTAIPVNS